MYLFSIGYKVSQTKTRQQLFVSLEERLLDADGQSMSTWPIMPILENTF